ncbi:MAG: hypothetical protein ACOX4C_09525 [Bacillota bacterium]
MTAFVSISYTVLCGLMVIGLVHRMFTSRDVYEQITCGVSVVPFLLRALHIR